jgi:RNA polymerase subunit RPABC4/transcription elongation factor Spt4
MNQCQNCGQINNYESNFCRFCGNRMVLPQNANNQEEYIPPRPYMWKTDEFQVNDNQPRKKQNINQVQPIPNQGQMNQAVTRAQNYNQPANFMTGYRCPRCGSTNFPFVTKQVSTAGWITFAVLLVTTGIFFWIGLLIREDVRVCSNCGLKTK